MQRRAFLQLSAAAAAGIGLPSVVACGGGDDASAPTTTAVPPTTATTTTVSAVLGEVDANGLRLLPGFTSRVVATAGEPVAGTGYAWHPSPDGGACFASDDGGWVYVSNSEHLSEGGASMVRFAADGSISEARRILSGTQLNCAGGATPWGTWLSCEEHPQGEVWECDPTGATPAVARPAMGLFKHEAAAVDEATRAVYLTEDEPEGALYRFVPTAWGDLAAGALEVLTESAGALTWQPVPDPAQSGGVATRDQVPGAKRFDGGEGTCMVDGAVVFTSKGDDTVWRLDPATMELTTLYVAAEAADPVLKGVDNVTLLGDDLYVCEDGDDMQVVRLRPDGVVEAVVQVTGTEGSEITGVAFSPDGRRMYFSSQRDPGRTYEVEGPW